MFSLYGKSFSSSSRSFASLIKRGRGRPAFRAGSLRSWIFQSLTVFSDLSVTRGQRAGFAAYRPYHAKCASALLLCIPLFFYLFFRVDIVSCTPPFRRRPSSGRRVFTGYLFTILTRWVSTDMRKWAIPIVIFFVAIPGIGVFMLLAAPAYTAGLLLPLALAAAATVGLILRGFRK